jgi:hypothetical protein
LTDLPDPLTPKDCDLQDFQFMPLDVGRLRDSELASSETPEACWAAVLLWCASWHQVPAGSIPNDEQWIAKQAGYARRGRIDKEWAGVRPGAMRGWIACSDGRLYHAVVAEKAMTAWRAKLKQAWKTECNRVKKHNQRHGTDLIVAEFDTWTSLGCPHGHPLFVPGDNAGVSQGQTVNVPDESNDSPGKVPGDNASNREGDREGQGYGEDKKNSVEPSGSTGGEPPDPPAEPPDPAKMTRDELWAAGKSLLSQSGMPAKQCGTFVGALVRDYTAEIVVDAVRTAVLERPADPAPFLKALCQRKAGERKVPNRQEALEKENREAARRLAAGGA